MSGFACLEGCVDPKPGVSAVPILRLHVRPEDWERQDWRETFEAVLQETGWVDQSVEPPSTERAEYVYLLVLER